MRLPATLKQRVFGVGSPKSGTHSLAGIFQTNFRASHEQDARKLISLLLGRGSGSEIRDYLAAPARAKVQIDVSQLNVFVLDEIRALWPDALFVLTIRDCLSWCDSFMRHQLAFPAPPDSPWGRFRLHRFMPAGSGYEEGDQATRRLGLFPLRGYLRYWRWHNETVLSKVEASKLLLVRTAEIGCSLGRLASFVGAERNLLDDSKAHLFVGESKPGSVIGLLPREHIFECMESECRDLNARFFPEQVH